MLHSVPPNVPCLFACVIVFSSVEYWLTYKDCQKQGKNVSLRYGLPSGQLHASPESITKPAPSLPLPPPCRGQVMVAEALDISRETYFAILMDRSCNGPVMVGSPQGGMDIEEVAATNPELIFKVR